MSNITKDQIFAIHESLVDTFAKDPKSQELLKKWVLKLCGGWTFF